LTNLTDVDGRCVGGGVCVCVCVCVFVCVITSVHAINKSKQAFILPVGYTHTP
jgi:hypothetical protein